MPPSAPTSLADLFLAVRQRKTDPLASVHEALTPRTLADAYAVQDAVGLHLGPIRGWKVGAETPQSEPFAAPIHAATIFEDGDTVPAYVCRHLGVEAEIGYRFAKALPPRAAEWTADEVMAAIGSIHPMIEIVDTRFEKPGSQHKLLHTADHQSHGALIAGPGLADWRGVNPTGEPVSLTINGRTVVEHVGGNSAGDPLRLLVWLANHAARRGPGIEAGCLVTTGSTTGTMFVVHDTDVRASFPSIGTVHAHLA
ncbi:2-keto-4-pentenoate hydratase [Komagataeibacter xylinus]|uniref:2-keto-4-pentenoate hydratase n=1 Tax=Komagataeibacter xylinus TaxID=28448 RepID=UPI00280C211E|nr:2-keto-4-pentenoate hydratase [Komagataeibacter xylinus]